MSYLMIMRMRGKAEDTEALLEEWGETMRGVANRGREAGAIHHAFYAGDGEVLVVDEWDDPESFQKFFEAERVHIGPWLEAAKIEGEPEVKLYRKLETGEDF